MFAASRSSAQMISYEFHGHERHPGLLIVGIELEPDHQLQSLNGWMVLYSPISFIHFHGRVVRGNHTARVRFAGSRTNSSAATTRNTAR